MNLDLSVQNAVETSIRRGLLFCEIGSFFLEPTDVQHEWSNVDE
jgi:hypothetical protein